MKLTALALVLLLIYLEVQPQKQGPYKDHAHDVLNEKVAGWDDRCEFYFVGPGSGRGGFCYGIGLIPIMYPTPLPLVLLLLCTLGRVEARDDRPIDWNPGQDGYFEVFQPWDKRFNYYNRAPTSYMGGACYGYLEAPEPVWLGNQEFLDKDERSFALGYRDYVEFFQTADHYYNLTVYEIIYNGKPLYGWFHVKLVSTNSRLLYSLDQVLIQLETELDYYGIAGSFVRTKFDAKSSCALTESSKDKKDYIPCQWAIDPFIMAHTTFGRRTGEGEGLKLYQWNVKLEFPLCSIYYQNNGLYFRTLILSQQINYRGFMWLPWHRKIQLKEYVYGAPDPEPPAGSTPDCSQEMGGGGNSSSSWVLGRGEVVQDISVWGESCHAESFSGLHEGAIEPQYSWGGRCCAGLSTLLSQKSQPRVPRVTHKYNCRRMPAAKKFIFRKRVYSSPDRPNPNILLNDSFKPHEPEISDWSYPEVNDYLKQALEYITKECRSEKCTNVTKGQTREGLSASGSIGRYIYAGRQGHGILTAIACLFVYPLTNFVSRYFKGTFMSTRYIANIHPWFAVHIYGTLTTLTFLVTGVGMGIYAREYLGYSFHPAGRIHVALGYITCFLFLGGIVSNALRCGLKASWNCSIILHACFGVSFYYLSLVAIATSVWIPASPGGKKLKYATVLDTIENSALIFVTLLFPIFEIIVHVIGTIQMCKRDVRFGVLRDWACFVAIPRVAAGEHYDEAGTGLKSILFVIYVLGSFIATVIVLVTIGTSDPKGHFFGKMTYTHVNGKLSTQNVAKYEEAEDVLE